MSGASNPSTLNELLAERAGDQPDRLLFRFLSTGDVDGRRVEWTYGQLHARASAIACELQRQGAAGDRALLLYPPGLEFVAAFFGCLLAGVVPVPCELPARVRLERGLAQLQALVSLVRPRLALSDDAEADVLRQVMGAHPNVLRRVAVLSTSSCVDVSPGFVAFRPDPQQTAYLQFTSGSTTSPRGVMVTHANVMANQRVIQHVLGSDATFKVCGWLPMFHDMGLVGQTLHPLFLGTEATLLAPVHVMARPVRWLRAISKWGAVISPAPDFAYQLCVRRIASKDLLGLDLSSWTRALNGAEPVRATTIRDFTEKFAPCGFAKTAMRPVYGLAEATLMVTGHVDDSGVRPTIVEGERAQPVVNCGRVTPGHQVRIVEPKTCEAVPDGRVGEIWVTGASVCPGYYDDAGSTREVFGGVTRAGEGPCLRTGDLGFLKNGDLFVTGRCKDLIIVGGRNLYPQDVERVAQQATADIRVGGAAAFGLDVDGVVEIVLVVEATKRRSEERARLAQTVVDAVAEQLGIALADVRVVAPRTLPVTSSGKVRRGRARDLYRAGSFGERARSGAIREPTCFEPSFELLRRVDPRRVTQSLEVIITAEVAKLLGKEAASVETDAPLMDQGLDSALQTQLRARLESGLGIKMSTTAVYNQPTISELCVHLAAGLPVELRPTGHDSENTEDVEARLLKKLDELDAKLGDE